MIQLETPRLHIRPFIPADLETIHAILDASFGDGSLAKDPAALAARKSWLQWSILSQEWLPKMHQPTYGDLAVVRKESQEIIGSGGLVPCLDFFDQIPALRLGKSNEKTRRPEVGLYWVIAEAHRKRGYAAEAGQALIDYAFQEMHLGRIIATTEYDNLASQAVMRRLGMALHRNPQPDPPWLQVVGLLTIKDVEVL
jgi:ribosomal-protein-alanine N-acetyltransferase